MGYRVVYEPVTQKQEQRFSVPKLTLLFFLLFLLLVNGFWPKGTDVLRQIVWPGDPEKTWQAMETMVQEMQCGAAFSDAAESFVQGLVLAD